MKKTWIAAWALLLMLLLPLCAAMAEATDSEAEFYGTIGKKMTVYRDASESAAALGKLEAGTVVDVYKKGRTWTRIGYEGGQGKVTLRGKICHNRIELHVEDQGVGIPDVEKAMEPLFTTRPELDRSGMGFAFMEAFMDELAVESGEGKGTLVRMKKTIYSAYDGR